MNLWSQSLKLKTQNCSENVCFACFGLRATVTAPICFEGHVLWLLPNESDANKDKSRKVDSVHLDAAFSAGQTLRHSLSGFVGKFFFLPDHVNIL